ncbi:hypothetical protein V1511DRAFT_504852 [Dipodascopsis uninucleata]
MKKARDHNVKETVHTYSKDDAPITPVLFRCPIEAINIILSYLGRDDLLNLRKVCRQLEIFASLNTHWKHLTLKLWSKKTEMRFLLEGDKYECFSFTRHPNGWFRAYCTINKLVKSKWMDSINDLSYTLWRLYMPRVNDSATSENFVAVTLFSKTGVALPLSGLSLVPISYTVDIDRQVVELLTYPPYQAGRDPTTWQRLLFNNSSYMLAEEPRYFESLCALHEELTHELYSDVEITELTKSQYYSRPREDFENYLIRMKTIFDETVEKSALYSKFTKLAPR